MAISNLHYTCCSSQHHRCRCPWPQPQPNCSWPCESQLYQQATFSMEKIKDKLAIISLDCLRLHWCNDHCRLYIPYAPARRRSHKFMGGFHLQRLAMGPRCQPRIPHKTPGSLIAILFPLALSSIYLQVPPRHWRSCKHFLLVLLIIMHLRHHCSLRCR